MKKETIETIEKSTNLIAEAANAIPGINEALGSVIIRAADLSSSGSTIEAVRKTLPDIVNQILFSVNQIKQAMKEETKPADAAEPAQEQTETRVACKKK